MRSKIKNVQWYNTQQLAPNASHKVCQYFWRKYLIQFVVNLVQFVFSYKYSYVAAMLNLRKWKVVMIVVVRTLYDHCAWLSEYTVDDTVSVLNKSTDNLKNVQNTNINKCHFYTL